MSQVANKGLSASGGRFRRPRTWRNAVEWVIPKLLSVCALLSVVTTFAILLTLLVETASFFEEVSIIEFVIGTEWTALFSGDLAKIRRPSPGVGDPARYRRCCGCCWSCRPSRSTSRARAAPPPGRRSPSGCACCFRGTRSRSRRSSRTSSGDGCARSGWNAARRAAQRGRMPLRVRQSVLGEAIHRRHLDPPTEWRPRRQARVVVEHDQHIRRALRRLARQIGRRSVDW